MNFKFKYSVILNNSKYFGGTLTVFVFFLFNAWSTSTETFSGAQIWRAINLLPGRGRLHSPRLSNWKPNKFIF